MPHKLSYAFFRCLTIACFATLSPCYTERAFNPAARVLDFVANKDRHPARAFVRAVVDREGAEFFLGHVPWCYDRVDACATPCYFDAIHRQLVFPGEGLPRPMRTMMLFEREERDPCIGTISMIRDPRDDRGWRAVDQWVTRAQCHEVMEYLADAERLLERFLSELKAHVIPALEQVKKRQRGAGMMALPSYPADIAGLAVLNQMIAAMETERMGKRITKL